MLRINHSLRAAWPFFKMMASNQDVAENRRLRAEAATHAILAKNWGERDLKARREYWYKQMYFLFCLLEESGSDQKEIPKKDLIEKLNGLINSDRELQKLMGVIQRNKRALEEEFKRGPIEKPVKEDKSIEEKPAEAKPECSISLHQKDIIQVISEALDKGFIPVVNNAANSNRDGSAKISYGSLEEMLARHTDAMLTMPLHFRDVNDEAKDGEDEAWLLAFQFRYLRAVLSMAREILLVEEDGKPYLDTNLFLLDYLQHTGFLEKKDKAIPIHFDMQNRVYQVQADGGFVSHQLFYGASLSSMAKWEMEIKKSKEERQQQNKYVVVVHAAAPDRRKIEGACDRLCTTDDLLRRPYGPHTLREMIGSGIDTQCQQAIKMKSQGQKPALIFVLPGCGAFGNPLHETIQIFLERIENYIPTLEQLDVPFCIVEKNPKIRQIIQNYIDPPKKKPAISCGLILSCLLVAPIFYLMWVCYKRYEVDRYRNHVFFKQEKIGVVGAPSVLEKLKEKTEEPMNLEGPGPLQDLHENYFPRI